MILVRNVFRLKFGKAREGVAASKETIASARRAGGREIPIRLLTDLTGEFYTVVIERTYPGMIEFEATAKALMAEPQWQAAYQKLIPLVESGHRDIFTIVDVGAAATA
jgi:hypothetical protein